MPRSNSLDWSAADAITWTRLNDINQDLDDLYANGSDQLRVVAAASGTPLRIDIGAGGYRVGTVHGVYAGGTDLVVTNSATNYVMIDSSGTIVINTTGWVSTNARLAIVTCAGGVITSIVLHRPDVFGGDLSATMPQVLATTMSGNINLDDSDDRFQILDPNGSDRTVTLDTPGGMLEGVYFYIQHAGAGGKSIAVKQSSTTLVTLRVNQSCVAYFDGTNWGITQYFSDVRFGDGRDGALNVTSGTTTIDCTGLGNLIIKQYTSFNVSAGATLAFSNVPVGGIVFIPMVQGNYTCAGTIDLSACGSAGGAGVSASVSSATNATSQGNNATTPFNCPSGFLAGVGAVATHNANTGPGANAPGASSGGNMVSAGTAGSTTSSGQNTTGSATSAPITLTLAVSLMLAANEGFSIMPGAGGGSGGAVVRLASYTSGTFTATSLAGGRGGGSLYAIVGGTYDFTGTYILSGANAAGNSTTSTGSSTQYAMAAGGSAGGAPGVARVIHRGSLVADSGTVTANGGTGGTAATAGAGTNFTSATNGATAPSTTSYVRTQTY